MWFFIFAAMFIVSGVSAVYMTSRFYKFTFVKKIAGDKRLVRLSISAFPVALILVVSWLALGRINALVVMIHFLFIWLICDLCNYWIQKRRGAEFQWYYAGILAIVITVAYLSVAWFLAHHVWSTAYTVQTDKEVGSLRIVQIADSHVGTTFDGEGFARWMQKIQNEGPDVVVVTGDYVDDDTTREDMVASCKALGNLKTTYGVYFSFGNHDEGYYGDAYRGYSSADLVSELEKNGVIVLQDESVLLDDRFYIIGRKDRSEDSRGRSRMEMADLVKDLDQDKYMVVLDHQPHDYDAQEQAGVDLVLSGHTHGGQFFPINYVGEWTGENAKTYGLEKRGNTNFVVTSGISDWAIKFKTGCKSEYVVVEIEEGSN